LHQTIFPPLGLHTLNAPSFEQLTTMLPRERVSARESAFCDGAFEALAGDEPALLRPPLESGGRGFSSSVFDEANINPEFSPRMRAMFDMILDEPELSRRARRHS
jgi:hypothetical protein